MKRTFLLLVLVAIIFSACKEKNIPSNHDNSLNYNGNVISCDPSTKTVSALGEEFMITVKSHSAWSATTEQSWVTVSPNAGQGDTFVTIRVEIGNAGKAQVLFFNEESTATLTIERVSYSNRPTPTSNGMLPGEFSVSATKKVHFSQGNLQYVGKWKFAPNQWDYFGKSQSDNHRDLFGWGTGNTPNEVSEWNIDYPTYSEWGDNPITNGGNEVKLWRTLFEEEWVFLFYGRKDAAKLFGMGTLNGIKGTIILPDNWVGLKFANTENGLSENGGSYFNSNDNNYSHSTFTAEQWLIMESAGAVFLPAAGYTEGTDVMFVGSEGSYWSATPNGTYGACHLDFNSYSLNPHCRTNRYCGRSVRLVSKF